MITRVAVPVEGEQFCEHFGRCNGFFLCDLEGKNQHLGRSRIIPRPARRCESVPGWLHAMGVTTVLAGGIGAVARHQLGELGVAVTTGHSGIDPRQIIADYLAHPLRDKENACATLAHQHRHCRG